MKILIWICTAMLFIAIAPLPLGYYTLLRLVVTITAVLITVNYYKQDEGIWIIIFGLIAFTFNPFILVYLGNKDIWIPIDFLTGILFLYRAISIKIQFNDLSYENNI